MSLTPASVPQTMTMHVITEKPLEQIATESQYRQGTTERDRELRDFQFVHSSYEAGAWGYMAAVRMRRGCELFTLRD